MTATAQHALVLIDPSQEQHPALERAKKMVAAASNPENFELSILISTSDESLAENKKQTGLYITEKWIAENINEPLDKLQASYTSLFSWSDDYRQNILDIAAQRGTTMTIMPFYGKVPSHVLNDEKWKLTRNSTQPILVAFQGEKANSGKILSTIKVQDKKYQERNQQVIETGDLLARFFGWDHHVANAYADSTEYPDRVKIASDANLDNDRIHVKMGTPDDVICDVATEVNPDVVLIASQRRKGIKGALIGNTVEKIIERVERDVFII